MDIRDRLSGKRDCTYQDAEKVRQRRSRLESILNVAQRLRLRCFHRLWPCVGQGRVSARQGWAGEKSGLFEHPVYGFPVLENVVRTIELLFWLV
jgi:hypothetical protein